MRERLKLIAVLVAAFSLSGLVASIPPAVALGTLDVSQTDVPAQTEFDLPPSFRAAQTFISGLTGELVQVDLPVAVIGAPDPLVVNLLATDNTGAPTGSPLGTGTITAAQLKAPENGPTWVSVVLSPAVPVVDGGQYAIEIVVPGTVTAENNYVLYGSFEPGTYPDGSAYVSVDAGATWTLVLNADDTDQDLAFKTYVAPPSCTVVTGTKSGNVVLNGGTWCVTDARITGGLSVGPGTTVTVLRSSITGGVTASSPAALSLCDSRVVSAVNVTGATGPVVIGAPADGCPANPTIGSIALSRNAGGFAIRGNTIGGNVQLSANVASPPATHVVAANVIRGSLQCNTNNSPAVTNGGMANTVSGGRAGQCVGAAF